MRFTSVRRSAGVLLVFVLVSVGLSWPLPMHMGTHLTGSPEGDTGIYVWNQWVFRHELVNGGTVPLKTREILALDGPTDLSLHNYTVFSDLLAVPLLQRLGVVATFNLIYLINATLVGLGMYLLVRRLTGRTAESLLAGVLFACAPFLITRGAGHFSLAAVAPLPFFMLALYRAWDSQRLRDAVLAGVVLAWAGFSDPYYAVYCLMLAGCFLGSRLLAMTFVRRPMTDLRGAKNLVNVAIAALAMLILGVHVLAGGAVQVGVLRMSMRTLYTPMLLLTVLVIARLLLSANLRVTTIPVPSRAFVVRAALVTGAAAAVLMSPTLYAVGARMVEARFTSEPVYWRSSAPGVDVLSYLIPNPNHPLAPREFFDWLNARPGGFGEQVASISWVALGVILAAWRLTRFRPSRFWTGVLIVFGVMSIGPFLSIAGVQTHIPGPWALLRYAPLIGSARMPGRMSIVVMMAFTVLFACALVELGRRFPQRRRLLLGAVAVLLAVELAPAPRALHAASLPRIYDVIAADPRSVRVLELPTGVRDGLSMIGDFSPKTQFYQAFHGKGLIGGYLSRVSASCKQTYRRAPVMGALLEVSEGRKLSPARIDRALKYADQFMRMTDLGYVLMKRDRVSEDTRYFATVLFGLRLVAEADGYELYVPRALPEASPPPRAP